MYTRFFKEHWWRVLLIGVSLIALGIVVAIAVHQLALPRANTSMGIGEQLAGGHCKGAGPGQLTHSAMQPGDFTLIIPYGLMTGGHVTPIDHQYYSPISYSSPRDAYPIYAMGDSRLVSIEHRTETPQDNDAVRRHVTDEYRLVFSQSCTFFYYYDLLTSLTPELTKLVSDKHNVSVDVPVRAGDLIGHIGGQTLDFAVWNTEKSLSGFIVPDHYKAEPWKIYVADPLEYETPELKEFMISRSPRTDKPLSGKIDWDIDGTLRGTWFEKGTNYLEGNHSNPKGSWAGHLSFAPDLYDGSRWIVSMGDYPIPQEKNTQVSATQFYAKVGVLAPDTITQASGLVRLELVREDHIKPDGSAWRMEDGFVKGPKVDTSQEKQVLATALVQLTGQRTLKFEVFPGKGATDVAGFDGKERTYER